MIFRWILCQTCTKLKALLVFIWHISLKQCLHLIIFSSNSYQGISLQIEVKVDTWINAIHCRNKKYDKSIVLRSFCRIYIPALNVDLRGGEPLPWISTQNLACLITKKTIAVGVAMILLLSAKNREN